jgi:TolA-binding protein
MNLKTGMPQILAAFVIALLLPLEVIASGEHEGDEIPARDPDATAVFRFALERQRAGDYDVARTEYLRFISYFPDHVNISAAKLNIYQCLYDNGKYTEAAGWSEELLAYQERLSIPPDSLLLLRGNAEFKLRRYRTAGATYLDVFKRAKGETKDRAAVMRGICLLHRGEWEAAQTLFAGVPGGSGYGDDASEFVDLSSRYTSIPHRDAWLAGMLSAVLPGAGYVYAGHFQTGITALMVNSLFIWTTVMSFEEDHEGAGIALSVLSTGFYTGNIYGSIMSAYRFNRRHRDAYFSQFADWP